MSEQIAWIFQTSINEGEYDNLVALMEELVTVTQADEPGTLSYEWSMNEEKTVCHIYERYTDSAAAMVHMGNFGKFVKRFLASATPTGMIVYGNASDELKSALAGSKPLYMGSVGGFTRHG